MDLPLRVRNDFPALVGIDNFQVVYIRPAVDIVVDPGFLFLLVTVVCLQVSDSQRTHTSHADFDAFPHTRVFNKQDEKSHGVGIGNEEDVLGEVYVLCSMKAGSRVVVRHVYES
jgi:hypothetical protein